MAERVILHVGAMKTGTSFIQKRLSQNVDALRAQGVLVPGRAWNDQVLAVSEVLERRRQGLGERAGKWAWLVDEIAAWPGTAVVSMEFLGQAGPQKIRRVVDSFEGADLQVLLGVRDLNRTIPAMWQEALKNSKSWTWEEYVEGVRRERGPAGKQFWREQSASLMARRWVEAVGLDHFALMTVPPPGAAPDVLWERFCSVAGIEPGSCPPVAPANESLGAASALLLQRVNAVLEEADVEWRGYLKHVKHGLAKKVLAPHRAEEEPLGLAVSPWVQQRSRVMVRRLKKLGVRVVGDLSELEPVDVPGVEASSVTEGQQLDAAVAGLVGLLERQIHDNGGGPRRSGNRRRDG
jgi:hypothetical protein